MKFKPLNSINLTTLALIFSIFLCNCNFEISTSTQELPLVKHCSQMPDHNNSEEKSLTYNCEICPQQSEKCVAFDTTDISYVGSFAYSIPTYHNSKIICIKNTFNLSRSPPLYKVKFNC